MENQQAKCMESLVDKLCDHLPTQRVKLFIDNGFDEWETITYLKGNQFIDLGFDSEETLIIMVSINNNAKQYGKQEVFNEQTIQKIVQIAKENDKKKWQQAQKQEQENKLVQKKQQSTKTLPSSKSIKEYPFKEITENMLLKGTTMKPKQGQKISFSKITMISLQDKEITHMTNIEKVPAISNLHLANNHIYKIQGLTNLSKIKVLRLQHNQIVQIEGLQSLVCLERLNLSDNFISRLQNLTQNKNLHILNISRQKINENFTFDPQSIYALSYCLQKLQCDKNKVNSISQLKYLRVIHDLSLAKNQLQDIGQLSESLSNFEMLKTLTFKDNPLAKTQKYRDYIVILSKNLEELDGKKILTKERQYLVKLYALKHAKQNKQPKQKPKSKEGEINLQGVRMDEDYGSHNLNRATDLRGNGPHTNTKHIRK